MEYITLKHTDLVVSRLCMGGCPMGGYGWGNVCESDLIEAVHTALDSGITFFDTADTYGLGQSEKTLSKALGSHRSEVVIASKFGVRVEPCGTIYDNSPSYIRKALDGSLLRLGTDYIDLYQVHYLDGRTPIEEIIEELETLQKQGKIRYFGFSNLLQADLPKLMPYASRIASFQDEFSLACRSHEADIQAISQALEITPMTWGSLGQGVLTGKYTKDVVFDCNDRRSRDIYVNFHGNKLLKNLEIVDTLRSVAAEHGVSVSSCAIRFILDYFPNSVALVGAKRAEQVHSNVGSMGWSLSETELAMLNKISMQENNIETRG